MPRCMHTDHVHSYEDKLLYGFDRTRRHWQICDEGFVATRKERRRARPQFVTAEDGKWENHTEIRYVATTRIEAPPAAQKDVSDKTRRFQRRAEQRKAGIQSSGITESQKGRMGGS